MQQLVWYVSYGSNMCRDRLMCYLRGGRPPGAHRSYPGARDHTPPRAEAALSLPGRVYFAGESPVWGGGVAFYDPDGPPPLGGTPARGYLLTAQQFADVAAQEMSREPGSSDSLEQVLGGHLPSGRYEAGPGAYETLVDVGRRDDIVMLTFTAPYAADSVTHTWPSAAYRRMIGAGLRESHHFDQGRIDRYLDQLVD